MLSVYYICRLAVDEVEKIIYIDVGVLIREGKNSSLLLLC
jgi:hypothetical protein